MPNISANFGCPAPFLNVEAFGAGGFTAGRTCLKQYTGVTCCLPCPMTDWVYPDSFNILTDAASWVAVASAVCCVGLLATWAFLPVEKTHRNYLSICLSIAIIFMNLGFIVPLAGQPEECYDAITPNDMHTNNICAASGAFLIFGGWSAAFWVFLRSLSLHLQICWQVVAGRAFMWLSILAGWGVPVIGLVLALALSGVSFRMGTTCHINHQNSLADLWIPLLIFAAATIIIQFVTFMYCVKVYLASLSDEAAPTADSGLPSYTSSVKAMTPKQAYSRVKRVIQLQWRGVCVVFIIVADVVFFSTIFVMQDNTMARVQNDPALSLPWITCLLANGGDKDKCLDKASGLVINQAAIGAVLILLAMNGFWIVFFLGRWTMITGWWELFVSGPRRRKHEFVSSDAKLEAMTSANKDSRAYEMLSRDRSAIVTSPSDVASSPRPGNAAAYQSPKSPAKSVVIEEREPQVNPYAGLYGTKSNVASPNPNRSRKVDDNDVSPPSTAGGRTTPDFFGKESAIAYHAPARSFSSPRPPTAASFEGSPKPSQWGRTAVDPNHYPTPQVHDFDQPDGPQHPLGMNKF